MSVLAFGYECESIPRSPWTGPCAAGGADDEKHADGSCALGSGTSGSELAIYVSKWCHLIDAGTGTRRT